MMASSVALSEMMRLCGKAVVKTKVKFSAHGIPNSHDISMVIGAAIRKAGRRKVRFYEFEFRGIRLVAHADSNPDDVFTIFTLKDQIRLSHQNMLAIADMQCREN